MTANNDNVSAHHKPYTQEDARKGRIATSAIAGYLAVGVLLALLTPADILERPWAAGFVGWMAEIVPQIGKIGTRSSLSGVAQFYSAVMWILAPVVFVLLLLQISECGLSRGAKEMGKHKWLMSFVFLVFIPAAVYVLYAEPGSGTGKLSSAMVSSRAGLALLHSLAFAAVPLGCAGVVIWCRLAPRLFGRT